jgi:hypothetical protein
VTYLESINERDDTVARRMAMNADNAHRNYREWIQEELKDAIRELQILDAAKTGDSETQAEISQQLRRVHDINGRELEDLNRRMRGRLKEVAEGENQSFLEDREYLEEVLCRFEGIVRELLRLRSFLVAQSIGTVTEP